MNPDDAILLNFAYQHLPQQLKDVSKPFHDLAHQVKLLPEDPAGQRAQMFQRLLEAKDCAVRVAVAHMQGRLDGDGI